MTLTRKFTQAFLAFTMILSTILSLSQPQAAVSAQKDDGIHRDYNAESGKVTRLTGTNNEPISLMSAMSADMTAQERSEVLVEQFAPEFGLTQPSQELRLAKESQPEPDRMVTKYQQVYQGIPVLGGELIVNASQAGELYSMNGEVAQELDLNTQPDLSKEAAISAAQHGMVKWYGGAEVDYQPTEASLWIFDESLLRPSIRPAMLVWKVEMVAPQAPEPIRELVLVDAHTGNIPLHFNQVDNAWENGKPEPSQPLQDDDPPTATPTSVPTDDPLAMPTPLPTEPPAAADIPTETFLTVSTETPLPTDQAQATSTASSSSSEGNVTAAGVTWYVATTGSDSNSCSTPAAPCLTIGQADWRARNGDTILVASGTYTGTSSSVVSIAVNLTISGGWDATYTQQSGNTILDGQNARQVIYIGGGTVILDRLTITNGSKLDGEGGGIYFWASDVTINNSTIKSNKARNGGGIYLVTYPDIATKLTLNNSTISGNEATGEGGAIGGPSSGYGNGTAIINNSTIADNKAWRGGGIQAGMIGITFNNSILARNSAALEGNDCLSISAAKNSIIQDMNCNTGSGQGYLHVDPLLSPILFGLAQPGYYTVAASSPAIDAGNPATCLPKDQRGTARPQGAACDIGSYEFTTNGPATAIGIGFGSNQTTAPKLPFSTPLVAYAVDGAGAPVANVSIQFEAPSSGASGTFRDGGTYFTTVTTDSNGIAKASTFTANSEVGTFDVTASAVGLGTVNFTSLTNRAWHVSKSGSDSNACNTPAAPCLTIQAAINKASPGDIIKITGESYTGTSSQVVTINKSLSIYGGWSTDFETQNGYTTVDGQNARIGILISMPSSAGTARLDRFVVQNGSYTQSTYAGAGIQVNGNQTTAVINSSLIKGNHSTRNGGGIGTFGAGLTLNNVTLRGNTADGYGGGIYFDSYYNLNTLNVNYSTIADNNSNNGGGIYFRVAGLTGERKIQNTIITRNTAATGPNCSGTITVVSHTLISNISGCTISAGSNNIADPLVSANLVGTPGHYSLNGTSPALNAGDPMVCPVTDQRGAPRPNGGGCDIGAFERSTVTGLPDSMTLYEGNSQRAVPGQTFLQPLAVYLSTSNGDAVSGVNVTFTAPGSGASGTFEGTGSTIIVPSDDSGLATTTIFTANTTHGEYDVIATAGGVGSVTFHLQNVALYVSRSGQDTTDCTTPTQPCYSLNYALSQAVSGDHIFVTGEAYSGTLIDDNLVNINNKNISLSGGWDQTFTTQNGQTVLDLTAGRGIYVGIGRKATVDRFDVRGGKLFNNFGGGVVNSGILTFTNGAIYNNSSHGVYSGITSDGGGIYSNGTQLALTNVTISNNEADEGGGLFVYSGTTTLNNVTITQNFATNIGATAYGGGLENKNNSAITITNSIIAGNIAEVGQDCHNLITSGGNNLIGFNADCDITPAAGDQIGTQLASIDAKLGDLGSNNSYTKTHALLAGSPAIDAGNPATCATADQRGIARPQGDACDIGAFEGSEAQVRSADIRVYSADSSQRWPGDLVCDATKPNCTNGSDPSADKAQQYALGTYNLFLTKYNRQSIDNNNMPIVITLHYCSNSVCPYNISQWSGAQVVFGDTYGYANADDMVAHELTHGVTQYESDLYPVYQSGAINESFSDLWGEYYDQTNGLGNDSPEVKWVIGEDITDWTNPAPYPLTGFRSMSNPVAYGDPDKMTSSLYVKTDEDSGGVHANAGVNNKAVYLMVDGGYFNTKTVTALGWEKIAALYYEAQTNLLTSASDYSDLYFALQQACLNLTVEKGITASDCAQVKIALDAVQMNTQAVGFNADPPSCPTGMATGSSLNWFADDFESGIGKWNLSGAWTLDNYYASSVSHMMWGNDNAPNKNSSLTMANSVALPAGSAPFLFFKHAFFFEYDSDGYYDGGVLEYTKDGGNTWLDAKPLFSAGQNYKGTISPYYGNVLKGRSAFVGDSHGYVSSRYDLKSLVGKTVKFRWRFATDTEYDYWGWFVDDVKIYQCIGTPVIPTLQAPAKNALTTDYTPFLNWSDVTPALYHYQIQIATDDKFTSFIYDQNDLTTSQFTVPSDLPSNTKYYWRVRALNAIEGTKGWSPVWTFRTALIPPALSAPVAANPELTLRPAFEWEDVPKATGYTIQISKNSTFTLLALTAQTTTSNYTPTVNLPAKMPLYWRVFTKGTNGPSAPSVVRSFVTPNPPSTPLLVSPTNNALNTNYLLPRLDWNPSTLPTGVTFDHYQLQVARDANFTDLILDHPESDRLHSEYIPSNISLDSNSKYSWRVQAFNTNGQYNTSATWTLRAAMLPPVLSTPPDGESLLNKRPTLEWNAVVGASGYTVVISRYANLSSPLRSALVTSSTYALPADLPANTKLYWHAQATGVNGPSLWSPTWSFTTGNPPSVPAVLAPANNALVFLTQPKLDWGNATAPAGTSLDHYLIQIATDAAFTQDLLEQTTPTSDFTPVLNPDTKYYWRVKAYNTSGQYSAWSTVRSFREAMLPATLRSPDNGSTATSLKPTFDWEDVSGASTYTIQISLSSTFSTFLVNSNAAGSTYTPAVNLPAHKTLYWRVRANGLNGPSAWTTFHFATP